MTEMSIEEARKMYMGRKLTRRLELKIARLGFGIGTELGTGKIAYIYIPLKPGE